MLTDQIVSLLIAERDKLSRAIEALQGPTKRRGRPPKNALSAVSAVTPSATPDKPKAKKRARTFNEEQRAAAGERMRARWAAKRASEGKGGGKAKKAAKA